MRNRRGETADERRARLTATPTRSARRPNFESNRLRRRAGQLGPNARADLEIGHPRRDRPPARRPGFVRERLLSALAELALPGRRRNFRRHSESGGARAVVRSEQPVLGGRRQREAPRQRRDRNVRAGGIELERSPTAAAAETSRHRGLRKDVDRDPRDAAPPSAQGNGDGSRLGHRGKNRAAHRLRSPEMAARRQVDRQERLRRRHHFVFDSRKRATVGRNERLPAGNTHLGEKHRGGVQPMQLVHGRLRLRVRLRMRGLFGSEMQNLFRVGRQRPQGGRQLIDLDRLEAARCDHLDEHARAEAEAHICIHRIHRTVEDEPRRRELDRRAFRERPRQAQLRLEGIRRRRDSRRTHPPLARLRGEQPGPAQVQDLVPAGHLEGDAGDPPGRRHDPHVDVRDDVRPDDVGSAVESRSRTQRGRPPLFGKVLLAKGDRKIRAGSDGDLEGRRALLLGAPKQLAAGQRHLEIRHRAARCGPAARRRAAS